MTEISRRHWIVSIGAAAALHIAVAVALLWEPPESGAQQLGTGGIEVALGPAGGSPGEPTPMVEAVPEATSIEPPAAEPVETAVKPSAPEVPEVPVVETPPVPEVEPVEAESPPEPEREKIIKAESPPEPAPAEEVALVEPVETRARPVAPPSKPRAPPPEKIVRETAQKSAAPAVRDAVPEPRPQAPKAAAVQGTEGKSGTRESSAAGRAADASAGGRPTVTTDYAALLQAWLEKHKEYPRRAQRRRQQGTALLYFVMDRDGRVLDYRIKQTSGHRLLDREVERMIERAQPLPAMPDEMRQARLELVVPVQFFLR